MVILGIINMYMEVLQHNTFTKSITHGLSDLIDEEVVDVTNLGGGVTKLTVLTAFTTDSNKFWSDMGFMVSHSYSVNDTVSVNLYKNDVSWARYWK